MNELIKEATEYLEISNEFDDARYSIDGAIAIALEDVLGKEFDYDICINTYVEEGDVWFEFDHGRSKEVRELIDEKTKAIEEATGSVRKTMLQMFHLIEDGEPVKKNE